MIKMKIQVALVVAIFYLVTTEGRYRSEHNDAESSGDDQNEDFHTELTRHRRRRHPSRGYGGYSYLPPAPYHDRYYERDQDLMPDIWRLLDEISTYVRRPPAPQPVIIYPSVCPACNCGEKGVKPTISNRFPDMDPNQNWGLVSEEDRSSDVEEDTPRPISFEPIKPPRGSRKPPPVDHGTSQAASASRAPDAIPQPCDNAKVSCCYGQMNQRKCFASLKCSAAYADGNACRQEEVQAALKRFIITYSPDN